MKTFFRVGTWLCCLMLIACCARLRHKPEPAEELPVDSLTVVDSTRDSVPQKPILTEICQYDDLIRAEAEKIGWDWRLIASIIYQESHFKPDLINHKGAFGLMQLMPITMEKYHIGYDATVEEQLEVGGKVLVHLDRKLSEVIVDSLERLNFVLASYNSGFNRVMSLRELALKHGKDPNVWADNVEHYSPRQTRAFVKEITQRHQYYKETIE